MTATAARKNFYSVIDMAKKPGNSVIITHNGLPEVVILPYIDFLKWQTMKNAFKK
jgi:prevent-host-death family protein